MKATQLCPSMQEKCGEVRGCSSVHMNSESYLLDHEGHTAVPVYAREVWRGEGFIEVKRLLGFTGGLQERARRLPM
jgi:hypothetical protein